MSEPIKKSEVIESDILKGFIEENEKLKGLLEVNSTNLQVMAKSFTEISKTNEKTIANVVKINSAYEKSNEIVDQKIKILEEEAKISKNLETAKAKLAALEAENAKELAKTRLEIQEKNKALKDEIKESKAAKGSIDQLTAANARLRKEVRALNLTTEEGRKKAAELNKQIDENTKVIKENVDSRIQQTMTVGDYSTAIKDALSQTGIFNSETTKLVGIFKSVTTGIKGATVAQNGLNRAFIASGIGLLIIALGSVISFLTSTQEGMDKVSSAMEGVSTYISVWRDEFNKLGKQIFERILPTFSKLGKAIGGILTFDFKQVTEAWRELGEVWQSLEPPDFEETNKKALEYAKRAIDLKERLIAVERAEYRYGLTLARNEIPKEKALLMAKDETIAIEDRIEALEKAKRLTIEEHDQQIAFAKQRLAIQIEMMSFSEDLESDKRKQIEIEKEIAKLEASRYRDLKTFQRDSIRLEKEITQLREKNRDITKVELEDIRTVANVQEVTTAGIVDSEALALEQRKEAYKSFSDFVQDQAQAITATWTNQLSIASQQQEMIAQNSMAMFNSLSQAAASGNIQASESLKEYQDQALAAQKRQIEIEKQKQNIQKASVALQLFTSQIQAGKDPIQALAMTGTFLTSIKALTAGAFFDGTEHLSSRDGARIGRGNKDNILIQAHEGERIVPNYINEQLKGVPNEMLPSLVNTALTNGGMAVTNFITTTDKALLNEIKAMRNDIRNMPTVNGGVEEALSGLFQLVVETKGKNNSTKNIYK
jgi:hypothetical protein